MSFRLPVDADNYFGQIWNNKSTNINFRYKFDYYYLCLIIGLNSRKISSADKVDAKDLVDNYPGDYIKLADVIAGLLIDAEIERLAIDPNDRDSIESLILELIDHQSVTRLSSNGMDQLNLYAARGLDIINEKIARTKQLEVFLAHYHNLLNEENCEI